MKKVLCGLNMTLPKCNSVAARADGKNETEKAAMFKEAIVR